MSRARLAAMRLGEVREVGELERFVPSPAFAPFVAGSDPRVLLRAANRVGKTRHAAYKAASSMVGRPGLRVRIVGPTRQQAHNVLGRYLYEFLQPHLSTKSYYQPGKGWNLNTIILSNGSICQLRSYEDRPDAHAGDSLDLVIMDEGPPKQHFAENQARVIDRNGQFVIALTAVNRPVDYLRAIVSNNPQWMQYVVPFRRENVPWYSEQQFADMMAAFRSSPWQWAQRVEAEWQGAAEGRIFSGFTEENVIDETPRHDLSVGIGLDHGTVAGRQVGVLVAYKGQKIWVLDEYTNHWGSTPEQDAVQVLAMLRRQRLRPHDVSLAIGDTNSAGRGSGVRCNDLIEVGIQHELGLQHPPFRIRGADKSSGSVDFGLRVLNHACSRRDLLVHERCTNVATSMRQWQGSTQSQREDGKLAHAADALRYVTVAILAGQPAYAHLRIDN